MIDVITSRVGEAAKCFEMITITRARVRKGQTKVRAEKCHVKRGRLPEDERQSSANGITRDTWTTNESVEAK